MVDVLTVTKRFGFFKELIYFSSELPQVLTLENHACVEDRCKNYYQKIQPTL